jgi:hypothetical protein
MIAMMLPSLSLNHAALAPPAIAMLLRLKAELLLVELTGSRDVLRWNIGVHRGFLEHRDLLEIGSARAKHTSWRSAREPSL